LWYLLLVLQVYLLFPLLRTMQARLGTWGLLILSMVVTAAARGLALWDGGLPNFDSGQQLVYFLPCRLTAPVLGMVVARWISRVPHLPRVALALGAPVALVVMVVATRISAPWTGAFASADLLRPTLAMMVALPAIWILGAAAYEVPGLRQLLLWTGRTTFSVLVAQDLLRLVTGTLVSLGVPLAAHIVPAAVLYVGAAIGITAVWDPLQRRAAELLWRREPAASGGSLPARGDLPWQPLAGPLAGGAERIRGRRATPETPPHLGPPADLP
jgi:peptidoglycan/LPS O-acetylase OafA/YrhL